MAPNNVLQGVPSLGPPGHVPNGHAPPNPLPPSANGASPLGYPATGSNQGPALLTGYPPGQQNQVPGANIGNMQQVHSPQTPQFPPPHPSSTSQQNAAVPPHTGMAAGGVRPGPPQPNMPYSPAPLSSNGPTQTGLSSPSRPPVPGAFGGPSQFQQSHTPRPSNDMSQSPGRPPMMGMPPMPPTYTGGNPSMTSPPGPMMPPMGGQGVMRHPAMGTAQPGSMGGYPPHGTGINTSSTVSS